MHVMFHLSARTEVEHHENGNASYVKLTDGAAELMLVVGDYGQAVSLAGELKRARRARELSERARRARELSERARRARELSEDVALAEKRISNSFGVSSP